MNDKLKQREAARMIAEAIGASPVTMAKYLRPLKLTERMIRYRRVDVERLVADLESQMAAA
jgi:hypothetical protein